MSAVAVPPRRAALVDHHVVDEAARVAQLLPRDGLEAGVDVADDVALPLGDEDHHVIVSELPAEEPGVALRGIGRRDP